MSGGSSSPASRLNITRLLVVILIISFLALVWYKYKDVAAPGYTNIPVEYQVKYLPADFKVDINPDDALAILTNPRRYKREFNDLVYDLNTSILNHVSNRMGLSKTQKGLAIQEYEKQHAYMRDMYYNDFLALSDTTSALYQTWYDNGATNSIEVIYQVASKYTCSIVNLVISSVVQTKDGVFLAKGMEVNTPCGIALSEALQPFVKEMEDRAAIEDFAKSKGLLQEKIQKAIAELATMEVQDKKGITKQLQSKIWGFSVSSSDIEITAISILKVGFKLQDYMTIDLNARNNIVTVTLAEPQVLSHEVYPKIEKLDIGWLREVEEINLNESFNVLREEFRREAYESNIMDQAKNQAVEIMNTMFSPLVSAMNNKYQLRVRFEKTEEQDSQDLS